MFAPSYFPVQHFTGSYFPPGAVLAAVTTTPDHRVIDVPDTLRMVDAICDPGLAVVPESPRKVVVPIGPSDDNT